MVRAMKKVLKVPGGKLGAVRKKGISRPGSSSGEDGDWMDFTKGSWMDFTKAARRGANISNPARVLKRNIKKR